MDPSSLAKRAHTPIRHAAAQMALDNKTAQF
jgi:hypothetical protein